MENIKLGTTIKKIREDKGISQNYIARNIISQSNLILCQENGQRKLRFRSESIALSLARLTNNLRGVTLKLFVRLKGVDYMTLAFCKTSKYCFSYATGDI
ncbi:MAG: hypothetical protein M3Z62_16305 [Metasolibacillus sp.]|uniref:hypothetical protein n=1 Tax=Metasolibacillus sp. TaxID=2703680 RepID=UPI0025F89D9A|nr:hypothetical protein [Metasolibacillus sp.]MCT6941979.1 hypothetical protein [Metasolibacillus sp.]